MSEFNLCPKCGGVPKCKYVGDNRNFIVAYCSECGFVPAKAFEASFTVKGALKIWNKRTSEMSRKLFREKNYWIIKGDWLLCPRCNVAQKKSAETEPTPFCPICGAWLTDETSKEWIAKNTCSSSLMPIEPPKEDADANK